MKKKFYLTAIILTIISVSISIGQTAYITTYHSNLVYVIDVSTNTIIDSIFVGNDSFGVSVSPDGTKVYVTVYGPYAVKVINTSTNTVIDSIPVNYLPRHLIVSPSGDKVYVSEAGAGDVKIINTATLGE